MEDILDRTSMANCKPTATPVDAKQKLSATDGEPATDATFYRSIMGALKYLTLTRPNIAYAANQASLYLHAPQVAHWNLVKRNFGTSAARSIAASSSRHRPPLTSELTPILIGQAAPTHEDRHRAIMSSLATHSSHGRLRSS